MCLPKWIKCLGLCVHFKMEQEQQHITTHACAYNQRSHVSTVPGWTWCIRWRTWFMHASNWSWCSVQVAMLGVDCCDCDYIAHQTCVSFLFFTTNWELSCGSIVCLRVISLSVSLSGFDFWKTIWMPLAEGILEWWMLGVDVGGVQCRACTTTEACMRYCSDVMCCQ